MSHRADPAALPVADGHYNRQKPGTPQFVPPGSCVVFTIGEPVAALWVTSWPLAEFTKHAWAGAWVNSTFSNHGGGLSSELIREAVAATRAFYGEPPVLGMITFVDASKVRHKRDPGRCYRKAGFVPARCPAHAETVIACAACASRTVGGLLAFQLLPEAMPPAERAIGGQCSLLGAA